MALQDLPHTPVRAYARHSARIPARSVLGSVRADGRGCTAHAERAILGTGNPSPSSTGFVCGGPCTQIQTALPNASAVTPPGEGRIDAWWALGKGTTIKVRLRVVH